MLDKYILDENGEPKAVASIEEWAEWYETADRKIAQTSNQYYIVSTVFLALDHGWHDETPLLFETMVFHSDGKGGFRHEPEGGLRDLDSQRYSTREAALEGHHQMCLEWLDGKEHDTGG